MKAFLAACVLLLPTTLVAQSVSDCDWRARADAIAEPWTTYTRTFANGDVRLALMDVVEPAAGALHLLIISPPWDELGTRRCKLVSAAGDVGFAGMLFEDLAAGYDPAVGLTFVVDVQTYNPETAQFDEHVLEVTLNQATGDIGASLFP